MNFLAHAVCTNGPDNVVFGAVMSDLVERTRTPKDGQQSGEILDGRSIHNIQDTLFDSHENLKPFRDQLFSTVRHFQNPILDVACDHVLAKNWQYLFMGKVEDYTKKIYEIVAPRIYLLKPEKRELIMRMIENDVLASYGTESGLRIGLDRLAKRSKNGEVILNKVSDIMDFVPKVETTLLGVLPDVYRRSQSCLIERGYQPEGQLHWREEFLSGEIFNGPNPERR